jgi:hypothetical protein
MKTVMTREDLEKEVIAGSEAIVVEGELAQHLHIAFGVKKYGWLAVAAFLAINVAAPIVGLPFSASIIAAIVAIGAGLFKSIINGYEIKEYSNSPMRLILNRKAAKNRRGDKPFGADEIGRLVRIKYLEPRHDDKPDGLYEATGILKEEAQYGKTTLIIDGVETVFHKVDELMGLDEPEKTEAEDK